MATSLLLPSNGKYHHKVDYIFYFKSNFIKNIYIYIHKSDKTPYKFNMNYYPFFYHTLSRTHQKETLKSI
jgi:hypothetical protein